MDWQPEPGSLQQLIQLLNSTQSTDNAVQQQNNQVSMMEIFCFICIYLPNGNATFKIHKCHSFFCFVAPGRAEKSP